MARFFFSYARKDARDEYLVRFFEDLCKAVAGRTGLAVPDVGFRDVRDIQVGQSWPDELADELSVCRAFVALYSPAYFDSDYCGREWQVFAGRERGYRQDRKLAKAPGLMVPVLWIHPRRDQTVPSDVQYTHEQFGTLYAEKGLEYLLRFRGAEVQDQYQRFLMALADRLVRVTDDHELPALGTRPDVRQVTSAFCAPGQPAGSAPPVGGPRKVWFVVVAGTADQLSQVRATLEAYGPEAEDWRPYFPNPATPVAPRAQAVAGDADLTSVVCAADDELPRRIAEARERNELVVLLVDPWTVRLGTYHDLMKAYDAENHLNAAVLIPWNGEDGETIEHAEKLRLAVRAAFANTCHGGDLKTFREDVGSHAALLDELKQVILEIQSRVIQRGEVARRAIGEGVIVRPRLTGPHG